MKKIENGFNPEEIIFCPTSLCNLKCGHCFVQQKNCSLNIDDALEFLENCTKKNPEIKIGFSGGEPFLSLEFLQKICTLAVDKGLMFDRLMTNGVWWKTEEDLEKKLQTVFDSGFDGKIGLSYDRFHNQDIEKIHLFISKCHQIFNDKNCVEILSVVDSADIKKDSEDFENNIRTLMKKTGFTDLSKSIDRKTGTGSIFISDDDGNVMTIYRFAQSFIPQKEIKLDDKKWFPEDYCQSTGNVLYVHADGNIAPCCGFANECPELFIGTIKDSYETLMKSAEKNSMVNICYNYGLLKKSLELQKEKILPKGKCNDMCKMCWWLCRYCKS